MVMPDGFAWNGRIFGSLSQVAFAMSVVRWEMSRSLLNIAKRPLPRLTLRGVSLTSKDAVS
jgi:hypothetical protein